MAEAPAEPKAKPRARARTADAEARRMIVRPFSAFGLLAIAPSAADLGYENVSGASVEQYLKVARFTERLSVPIMLRTDTLLRYGVLMSASLSVGLSLH